MIQEISRFVETIPDYYHTKDLPRAKGLHIFIDLEKNGIPKSNSYRSFLIDKKNKVFDLNIKGELTEIDYQGDIEKREYYSRWIESNKALDSSKKIHSSNAFSLWFKAKNLLEIRDSFDGYFKKASENAAQDRDEQVRLIKVFCEQELIQLISADPKFKGVDKEDYVKVYFNVNLEIVKKDFESYLKKNIFNKEDYNLTSSEGEIVGLSGFLNGANIKKQFMLHKTSHYEVNNRISQKTALNLYKFERLLSHKKPYDKLPNPLPIFIDKDELNKDVVRLYNDERVLHFREIIRRLFEQHQIDLSDYYLINWKNTADGPMIYDFDFVPQFTYKLSGLEIKNPMGIKDFQEYKIEHIFQFEMKVVRILFNNRLVGEFNEEPYFNYFGDINTKNISQINYQNILKYRTSFYDYIYKSRTQAITGKMFYDLIISTVMDDIKHDEEFAKTYTIREKLNILFSLNHIFDTNNNNFKGVNMASKIPEYQERVRKLFSDENYHIAEDDEFAFAAGQLIYYILKQSKSSNKSHALLEPYISKSDPEQFQQMIIRGFDQYKHAFEWYGSGKGRFEKLAGDILGYECKTNIKELLPVILAGYFSQSLIYEPSQNSQPK